MVKYVTFNHCNMSSNLIALKKKNCLFIIILMQNYIGLTRNSTKVGRKNTPLFFYLFFMSKLF